MRVVDFKDSIYGEYIKIEMDTYSMFASLSLVNVFQDLSKSPRPTAGVGYSPTNPTNGNVIARLVNVSAEHYEILSPGGDTHVFTENGNFIFRFKDTDTGVEGTSKAVVNWIDRTAPTATLEYSTQSPTNSSVFATLKPSEEIKVLNNGYYSFDLNTKKVYDKDGNELTNLSVDKNGVAKDSAGQVVDPFKFEFIDNAVFTFEFVDRAGNVGSATAKVNWIDFDAPIPTLTYSKDTVTNEDVTVTISFNEEATVVNNNNSTTYTFKENGEFEFIYRDTAGNMGTITASVDWIDKVAPTAKLKYEKQENKVIVTVINPSEEITYEEGIGVYEFTKNGIYTIVFYDKAGNKGVLTAVIDSLKEASSNKPENPVTPNKPNNSDGQNKPGNNSKPNTETPGSINTPEDNKPNTNKPSHTEYKKFTIKSIHVEIPTNVISSEDSLKIDEFEVSQELKNKFGNLSEYYDIYVANSNHERVDINSSNPIKISIRKKDLKEFIGVYEIDENNSVKPVEYVKNGNNIEIPTKTLGKYVVSYKELKTQNPEVTLPVIKEKKGNKNWV